MKIAFDENVPVQMVRVFKSLGGERRFKGFEFVSARDYAPKQTDRDYIRKSDVPWLERFAEDGGTVVISGNVEMMDVPLEMQALRERGFLVFFFERKWNQWDFYQKSALVLFYWEQIARKIKRGKAAKLWRIPNQFTIDARLRDIVATSHKIRKTPPGTRRKVPAESKAKPKWIDGRVPPPNPKPRNVRPELQPDKRQGSLDLTAGGPSRS